MLGEQPARTGLPVQRVQCRISGHVHYLVPHVVLAAAKLSIEDFGNKAVHLLLMSRGDAVPDLWRTVVQIVEAVQLHVLCVPEQPTLDHDRCCECLGDS